MIGLLAAAAIASPSDTPLPNTRVHLRSFELRATHGVVQQAARTPFGERALGWAPNLGFVATGMAGPRWLQGELSLHAAAARRSWGEAELRIEPRIGLRLQPWRERSGPFVGVAVGVAGDPGGVAPTAIGTLGWTAPGESLRPSFALETRYGVPMPRNQVGSCCCDCPPSPDFAAGGTGVLVSVGFQWVSLRGAVR